MILVYLSCLIVGGVLLLGSLLLGAIHGDADAAGDADVGDADVGDADVGDAEVDHDASAGHGETDADAAAIWLPFLSLRFWIFSLTFFGLCGLMLTFVRIGDIATALVSTVVGLTCGTTAAYIVHKLSTLEATGDVLTSNEYIGAVGTVRVKVTPGGLGKIRVSIRNQNIDLVARTTDDETFESGSLALIVEFEDNVASIARATVSTNES